MLTETKGTGRNGPADSASVKHPPLELIHVDGGLRTERRGISVCHSLAVVMFAGLISCLSE